MSRTIRPRAAGWLLAAAATTLLVVGCGDDSDDAATETDDAVVATIADLDITLSEVQALAEDEGFRELVKQDPIDGDLAASGAGRAALGRLIAERAVTAALDDAGLEVTDEVRAEADEAVGDEDKFSEGAREILVDAFARYLTIDRALREGEGEGLLTAAGVVERYPDLTNVYCGAALAVEPEAEEKVDAELDSGVSLPDVGVTEGVVGSTNDGLSLCGIEVALPSSIRPIVIDVPEGEVAKTTARRTANGETVVVYAKPTPGGTGSDEAVDQATDAFAERLQESGHAAWWDAIGPQLEVTVDPEWGVWSGTRLFDAAPEPEIIEPTGTTSTVPPTTAPPVTTTTVPPEPVQPQSAPTLAEQMFSISDPGAADPLARGNAAMTSAVPTAWHDALPVTLAQISGTTSLSYTDGRIEMGTYHLTGPWDHLQDVSAHEFGHQIAYNYGTQAELGAAPEGWPSSGSTPVERWADCVSRSFSGIASGSHGMSPCDGASYTWAFDWLAPGPSAHPRTS